MSRRNARSAAALLLLLVGGIVNFAHAQTVFKCVDAKGQSSFTRQDCFDPKAKKTRFAPLSQADRQLIAKNMDASVEDVRGLESSCSGGFLDTCATLEAHKTKTAAQTLAESSVRARAACNQGQQQSCRAVSSFRQGEDDQKARLAAKCSAGDKRACAIQARYTGLCADGHAESCQAFRDSLH